MYIKINTQEIFSGDNAPEEYIEITENQYNDLLKQKVVWQNNELVPNPDYRNGDWKTDMIRLGVTGSYGKTSTCEMLYQYLLAAGKSAMMISTNGVFRNNETVTKDLFVTSYHKDYLEKLLEESYHLYGIDYAVIEIKGELFRKNEDYVDFDIVGMTNFDPELINNFYDNVDLYKSCKNKALTLGTIAVVPKNLEKDFYHTDTYEYLQSFEGFNNHQIKNVSLAIVILQKMNLYTLEKFPPVVLRGRDEVFGNIVVDTGWCGYEHIQPMYADKKVKLIYIPIWVRKETEAVQNYRNTAKNALSTCEKIYVTKGIEERSFDEIREKFFDSDYTNVEYISDHKDCFDKAVSELQPDEILYIMTRTYFREFRDYVKVYKEIE